MYIIIYIYEQNVIPNQNTKYAVQYVNHYNIISV